jgi:hypothetical protein
MSNLGGFLYTLGGVVVVLGGFVLSLWTNAKLKDPDVQRQLREWRAQQAHKHQSP